MRGCLMCASRIIGIRARIRLLSLDSLSWSRSWLPHLLHKNNNKGKGLPLTILILIHLFKSCLSSQFILEFIYLWCSPNFHRTWYLPFQFSDLFCSVQFSHSVVSDSLRSRESQHARPPCSSPSPGVHSDSHPSSQWCHPAISSSVVPISSCPQSLPASESFPMSQLFAWGGQITGASGLASFLPKKSQGWSPSEWTGWISLQSKGLSRVFSNTTVQKHQLFCAQPSSQSNSHIHTWPQEKS